MYNNLRRYLLDITNEESTSNILRYVNSLAEIYNDETIELGIINYLAQVQEADGYSGKTELLSLILKWQTDILFKMGVKLNTVDYYSLDKLDAIIEMLSSIENYEDKYSLLCIIDSCEDNVFLIGKLTEEIGKRIDCFTVQEVIDEVEDRTIDLIKDYCQTTTDDVINTPTPKLERLALLKERVQKDEDDLYVIKNYILNGFSTGISLKNILAIIGSELIDMKIPILMKNIDAAFLLSGSDPIDAKTDLEAWANSTFPSNPDILVEIRNINFEALNG